jgi:hypothetical protein
MGNTWRSEEEPMNSPMEAIHRRTVGVVMGTASVLGRLTGQTRAVVRRLRLNGMPWRTSRHPLRPAPTLRLLEEVAVDESAADAGGADVGGVNVERALKLVGVWDPPTSTSPESGPAAPMSGSGATDAIHRPQQRGR